MILDKYFYIGRLQWKTSLEYRANLLVGLLGTSLTMIVFLFLWSSLYQVKDNLLGFDLSAVLTYYILAQLLRFGYLTNMDAVIGAEVKDGTLIRYLLKPVSYLRFKFAGSIMGRLLDWSYCMIPAVGLFVLFRDNFKLTLAPVMIPLLIWSLVLSVCIWFFLAYLIGLSAFWLADINLTRVVAINGFDFLAGAIIPVTFFPSPVSTFLMALPFRFVVYTPLAILVGQYDLEGAVADLALGSVWMLVLWVVAVVAWRKGIGKFGATGV